MNSVMLPKDSRTKFRMIDEWREVERRLTEFVVSFSCRVVEGVDGNFNQVVLKDDSDHKVPSSAEICRCANGFCVETGRGHDDSYFDDQSGGENGVQGTFGVVTSLIILVELFTLTSLFGMAAAILFCRSTK